MITMVELKKNKCGKDKEKTRDAPNTDLAAYPANLKAGYHGYPAGFSAQNFQNIN
jgi:hypothetical protein